MDDLKFPHENIEMLPLGKLIIDRRVQRHSVNAAHAAKIAAEFNTGGFGYLTVSRRDNGDLAVLDGQHRVVGMRIRGFDTGTLVPCDVRHGLSLQQEAVLFRLLNTMKTPGVTDRFLVRVVEGDSVAVEINRIADQAGWQIGTHTKTAAIHAAQALEQVYTGRGLAKTPRGDDGDALSLTLAILTGAWGHEVRSVASMLLLGVGAVCRRDKAIIDAPSLTQRLAALPGGPDRLMALAKSIAPGGRQIRNAVSFQIVQMHNAKRRTRVLPPWPLS